MALDVSRASMGIESLDGVTMFADIGSGKVMADILSKM